MCFFPDFKPFKWKMLFTLKLTGKWFSSSVNQRMGFEEARLFERLATVCKTKKNIFPNCINHFELVRNEISKLFNYN